jgi:hypothetical protein
MQPLDDKECYSYTTNGGVANGRPHRKTQASRAKPTPSKWDDAQKWLVAGRADGIHGGAVKHRNSNADDRRLLSSTSQNGRVSCSSVDGALEYSMVATPPTPPQLGESDEAGETKKIDCMVQQHGSPVIRPVCLRDMGTEMTPIASKEPSRTATPLRNSTPVARSPMSTRSSTPVRRGPEGSLGVNDTAVAGTTQPVVAIANNVTCIGAEGGASRAPNANSLESRAAAWDDAERAKFTAR